MEQQLGKTLLIDVDGHDTDFGLNENRFIVERGDCDLDWSPVVNAEEAHDVGGDVQNGVGSDGGRALVF